MEPTLKKMKEQLVPSVDWYERSYEDVDIWMRNFAEGPDDIIFLEKQKKEANSFGPSMIKAFHLGCNVFATVHVSVDGARVHIQEFKESRLHNLRKGDGGVAMDAATWIYFQNKLKSLSTKYSDASFVANNKLIGIISDDVCTLQAIISTRIQEYYLRGSPMVLNEYKLELLCDVASTITDCMEQTILCQALPHVLVETIDDSIENCFKEHCDIAEAKEIFFKCVRDELFKVSHRLFKCGGCIIDHPCQQYHSCLNVSALEKYRCLGKIALFNINIKDIVKNICKNHCTCMYINSEIFKNLCVDDFHYYFEHGVLQM